MAVARQAVVEMQPVILDVEPRQQGGDGRTDIADDAEIERYPFRPDEIVDSVADLLSVEPVESEMPEGL